MATLKLGMKQGVQESRYPVSLSHGYSQIGDETGVTRVKVPDFSHSWLHSNWGWNREYNSQGTQFLSLMATLKLGMKQGLQEWRNPISLIHAYSQIGDETGSTRIKVPNTTAQRHVDVMENYLFICKMFGTLKKAPGVLHKKYPKEALETCKERKRCLWLWIHCTADLQERMPFQKLCHVHKPIMKVGKISKPRMKVRKN